MTYLYNSRPMTREEYEYLIQRMDKSMKEPVHLDTRKQAALQTLIALGVHLGPLAYELLSITWSQVVDVGAYFFVKESYRQPLVLERDLLIMIKRNYEIVKPLSRSSLVFPGTTSSTQNRPIPPIRFNNMLANLFGEYDIQISDPNTNTLRRTFARKVWMEFNGSEDIVKELAIELRLYKGSVRRYVHE